MLITLHNPVPENAQNILLLREGETCEVAWHLLHINPDVDLHTSASLLPALKNKAQQTIDNFLGALQIKE